jgi:hypothetical protein
MSSKLITLLLLVLLVVAARCTSTPCPILLLCLLDRNSEFIRVCSGPVRMYILLGRQSIRFSVRVENGIVCTYVRTYLVVIVFCFVCRALWWCRGNQCTCLYCLISCPFALSSPFFPEGCRCKIKTERTITFSAAGPHVHALQA